MLIASRRVGEAFNIYAPDKETVICSLKVKNIESRHDVHPELTDVFADFDVFIDESKCAFDLAVDGMCRVHTGDELKLFDENKKNVICEILVLDIKTHHDKGTRAVNLSSRAILGFTMDGTVCLSFQTNKK